MGLGELHVAGDAGCKVVDHERADDGAAVLPLGGGGREPVREDEGRLCLVGIVLCCFCWRGGWDE